MRRCLEACWLSRAKLRRLGLVMVALCGFITASATPSAVAESQGSYCSKFAYYGDECIAGNLRPLTRSSTYSPSSGLYVSAGAYTPGGAPYASLAYGYGYSCHNYGGGNQLFARARNSDQNQNGNITGSKYWDGTNC